VSHPSTSATGTTSGTAVECSVDIDASCEEVFDVVHDYGIRLRWDTLLSKARIVDGSAAAGLGVTTLCVGRGTVAGFGMETVYISFNRPRLAAVKMTHGPWFVEDFAASIRHVPISSGPKQRSRVTYKFRIRSRPGWLRAVIEPVLRRVFQGETRKRLASLKLFIETRAGDPTNRTGGGA
jgi:Polyketide cyclase / dehydrase and lipid transport